MEINAVIEADRAIYAKLDAWNKGLVEDIYAHIVTFTKELEGAVRANAPTGRGNHGGRLKSSIHSEVRRGDQKIAGIVTSPLAYLPVIEFGLHKALSVGGHERGLDHAWSRDISPITVFVDPYTRQADVEGTFFMQRALEAMSSEITSDFRGVIDAHSGEAK